jgi:hypothetical protein
LEISSDNSLDGLQSILKHLYRNPEVAWVLGSIKKGLRGVDVAALPAEEREALLNKIQTMLEQSPTVLQALAEYRR